MEPGLFQKWSGCSNRTLSCNMAVMFLLSEAKGIGIGTQLPVEWAIRANMLPERAELLHVRTSVF